MSLKHQDRSSNARHILHTRIEKEEDIELHYTFSSTLGKGNFGTVVLGNKTNDQSQWAVKIINKEKAGSAAVKLLEREVAIMKRVDHPNIIHLEEVFETTSRMFLVMELCSRGCLEDLINKNGPITEQETLCIVCQLADAVAYIHGNDIIHRDLKLDNILLAEPTDCLIYNIKLTDFGLSYTRGGTSCDYMMNQMVGTPIYMAPEVITNYGYSQQCDIWSIGVIMYKLIEGHPPFFANNEEELFVLIQKGEIKFDSRWENVSQAAKQLLEGMLKVDPAHRLTSKEILWHPWIKGEQNVNGVMPTNVLELMKQYRLEQEELRVKESQPSENNPSNKDSNNCDCQPLLEFNKEHDEESIKKCDAVKKKNELESPKTSRQKSDQHLACGSKIDPMKASPKSSDRRTVKQATPSYMLPTRSSKAPKNPNIKSPIKK